MAGQRRRIFGWCEPSAYCRKHDGTQLTGSRSRMDLPAPADPDPEWLPAGARRARGGDVCGDLRSTTMVPFVRKNLTVADLGDLLDRPLVAVLATARTDGTVLLSPVYHEWRDGGFNVWVEQQNVKARHLRRDPRATILVAESDPPLRAVEVRGGRVLLRRVCPRPRCGS